MTARVASAGLPGRFPHLSESMDVSKRFDAALESVRSAVGDSVLHEIPALLGKLAEMKAILEGRYLREPTLPRTENRLLKVGEAAQRLGVSQDYLYRNAHRLAFTRRQGRAIRFSSLGIDDFIRESRR